MIFEEFELLKQKKLPRINQLDARTKFIVPAIESNGLIQDFLDFSRI